MAGRFADGAWLAELAPVQDRADVMAVVTAALGVRDQPGVPAADVLARVLARQQLLLVLDNCEHVIGAAAQLCAGLLAACNDVRVLATSREPLRIAGEARYRLGPLTLPGAGQAGGGGSEAVSLFLDRARGADPHFTVDGQAAAAVARLVTRLDGMPLAIELAAARVEALGVAQLLDRPDGRARYGMLETLRAYGARLLSGSGEQERAESLSIFLCKLRQSLSFCYITLDIFRCPGQTGTRLGNATANEFMAAFQPRVPVPRFPLSRTSPSPSMWRPVIFLIPR